MKILFIPCAYLPALGGTENTTRMIAEALAERGHTVSVATADISNALGFYDLITPRTGKSHFERMNNVDIYRIQLYSEVQTLQVRFLGRLKLTQRLHSVAMKVIRYRSRMGFSKRLDRLTEKLKPDVILTLPHLLPNVRIAASIAKKRGVPFGLFPHIHSNDPLFPHAELAKLCRSASVCFAITHVESDIITRDYKVSPDRVLFSGLGTRLPKSVEALQVDSTFIDVLFVGRKTASKGLEGFAKAVAELTAFENLRVILIGARAADTDLIEDAFRKRLKSEQFVSRDNVSDAEMSAWYNRCRIVVLPSKIESFGSVILEAWAHSRPIVTLDLPIFREIVDNGVDGFLAPPDDISALSQSIAELIVDPLKARSMGRAGYNKILKRYTWSVVVDRIEERLALL